MIHSYCNLRIVIVLLIIIVFDKINKLRLSHNSIHHFDTFQNNKIKVMRSKKRVFQNVSFLERLAVFYSRVRAGSLATSQSSSNRT